MNMKRAQTQQQGSMILEAMIAILIFSMGILALVGLQATAINTASDAKYRSTAGFLADQMIGTVWAARQNSTTAGVSNVIVANPDPSFACNPCNSTTGNAYTQAWAASGVAANLPGGQASIVINGAQVTVTVQWTPPKQVATAAAITHHHVVSAFIN